MPPSNHTQSYSSGFFFLQFNTKILTISLVSIVSQLFRKLTSRVNGTWVHCSYSSLKYLSYMCWQGKGGKFFHVERLEFLNQNLVPTLSSSLNKPSCLIFFQLQTQLLSSLNNKPTVSSSLNNKPNSHLLLTTNLENKNSNPCSHLQSN